MLVRDTIAVLCENHTKLINTLFTQNAGHLSLKQVDYMVHCAWKNEETWIVTWVTLLRNKFWSVLCLVLHYNLMCLVKWIYAGSFSSSGGDMEIVNEAEFYTLHPFAVQSEVHIEDRQNKSVIYVLHACYHSLQNYLSSICYVQPQRLKYRGI